MFDVNADVWTMEQDVKPVLPSRKFGTQYQGHWLIFECQKTYTTQTFMKSPRILQTRL